MRWFTLVALVSLWVGGCGGGTGVVFEDDDLRVTAVSVGAANVFVVDRDGARVMIDSGNPGDEEQIESNMRAHGIEPSSIDYLILTHGHVDHGGTAAYFQRERGVKVIGGRADAPMMQRGGRDQVCPTSTLARVIRWFRSGMSYPSFELDIPIDGDFDLGVLEIDGRIRHWPGHTPGSLVVEFDDQLFVGDLIRGGILARETPATHFFMCDLDDNRKKIRALAEIDGIRRWYPGHFGPLGVEAVRAYLQR